MYHHFTNYAHGITGECLTTESKGYAILKFISENLGASKYDCVTKVLGKSGDKKSLRGYYSVYFAGLKGCGFLSLDTKTHKYSITETGKKLLKAIETK